jgi:hypothetical protein
MAYGYQPVTVVGSRDYKYTNPGGLVMLHGHRYVAVRRTPAHADMATDEAQWSDIVLLRQEEPRVLVDVDEVFLKASPEQGRGYEDPRVFPGGRGISFTFINAGSYRTWMVELREGQQVGPLIPMGPHVYPAKNGYLYEAEDGCAVVVNRSDERRAIQFYRFRSYREAVAACRVDWNLTWWKEREEKEVTVPSWLTGEHGGFRHCGFGTLVHERLALLHFARSDDLGKYYVTAMQPLDRAGIPIGAPEIIAEPTSELPHGDVPNVIYTTMAWVDGRQLVLWSGHDDSSIVECRLDLPRWALPR